VRWVGGWIGWKGRRRRAAELLGRVGAEISPEAPASALSMPQQQLVEIARALGANARVLIMDEPTASLSEREAQNLFRVIAQLRTEGRAILYITHRLDELPALADCVTVLRDGETVATRPMPEVNRQELIRLMVGRELRAVPPKQRALPGDSVLELRQVGCRAVGVDDVTLDLCAGEILGLAGLVGAGRTGLARILFGLAPASSGTLRIRGSTVHIRSPRDAMHMGLAYLPEDRLRHGVIGEMPVSANLTLAALRRLTRFGFLDARRERELAARFVQQLEIKAPSLSAPVATLSGGNQQKVALGRWLATRPSVLILDEPTQGIDVGAKAEIHAIIAELAAQGAAVLMISSELPEILALSDRIAVMRAGRIAGILERTDATQAAILDLALHG
jgi:rhamnose transport system ATP-binding protein